MRDIKSLYLEAKRTGSQRDIDHYMEAVDDLANNDPLGYISNLEYIISSSSGLQTLHEFVEKNGMPLACVDTLEACLEKCINKCEAKDKDPSPYKKVLESVQKARIIYDESFAMFEYYKENLPENYVETYYGKNPNGVPNRKLIAGMLERFGEACIPDMLQVADAIGESALQTAIGYIHDHYLHEKNDRVLNQWVYEAAKTTHLYRIPKDESKKVFVQLYENTLSDIIDKMKDRKSRLYRESVIMGDDSLMMEYSEDEIKAIEDMISFKEYQMVATPAPQRAKIFQEESYALYEELDGLVPDNEELLTEKADAKKLAAAKIASNMKALATKIKKAVGPEVHKSVKDANIDKSIFSNKRVATPSIRVTFGDRRGPFTFAFIKNKVKNNLDEILDFSSEWIKGIVIYIELVTDTGLPIRGQVAERYWKVFMKGVNAGLKDLIKDNVVSLTANEPQGYVSYVTTFRIPVFMSKSNVIEDVDLDFDESSKEFLEMIADSVIPMLPGDGHDIMEAQWQYNTMNKKTGGIPGYLKNNHDLGYGEDEPPSDKKDKPQDSEYTLDDFKRPSASKIEPTPEPEDPEPDPERTDKPVNGVNNYYYYTYNNSLNKNHGSFNRTRTDIKDDHSTGKRTNSDDINSHNTNVQDDEDEDPEAGTESFGEGFLDKLKSSAKKLIKKIKGYIGIRKSIPNVQHLDKPAVIKKKVPMTIPGTNIPITGGSNTSAPVKESYDLEELIESGYYLSEDADDIPGLSKNDIKNIVNKLRAKFKAEIVFIHGSSDLVPLIGPASVIETSRKTIDDIIRGKETGGQIDSKLLGYEGKLERVIVVNPKIMTMYELHKPEEVEMVISHEYGHVLTFDQVSNDEWIEYQVKRQMISGLASSIGMFGATVSDETANAEANFAYYKLKPERLANEAAGIDPVRLTEVLLKTRSTGKLEGLDLQQIIDWKIPGAVMRCATVNPNDIASIPKQDLIDNITATKALYATVIGDKEVLSTINESLDAVLESYVSEAVGDADDMKPESDHPIKDVLTDIDRNLVGKQQKAKKAVQNVQNAGRAFMKPVNRTTQWIGNMVNKWKDADENNIKERMADPHARKNIFTAVGTAIKYGSLLKAGLLLNPVFLFLSVTKGIGRNKKEFRIRNEMIGELKTELEVIEEKIKDADRDQDKKAKYQLMRLKNEINKKLLRVGGDKQWKKIL